MRRKGKTGYTDTRSVYMKLVSLKFKFDWLLLTKH